MSAKNQSIHDIVKCKLKHITQPPKHTTINQRHPLFLSTNYRATHPSINLVSATHHWLITASPASTLSSSQALHCSSPHAHTCNFTRHHPRCRLCIHASIALPPSASLHSALRCTPSPCKLRPHIHIHIPHLHPPHAAPTPQTSHNRTSRRQTSPASTPILLPPFLHPSSRPDITLSSHHNCARQPQSTDTFIASCVLVQRYALVI